jgi:hypothetical protein
MRLSLNRLPTYIKANIQNDLNSQTPRSNSSSINPTKTRPGKMQAVLIPTHDRNTCWFCGEANPSCKTTCVCRAELTPTYDSAADKEIVYRIFSFGYRAAKFPSHPRLHEELLDLAVQVFTDTKPVAIRVGSGSEFAIHIKDDNGTVRSCAKTAAARMQLSITEAAFLQISRAILASHNDRSAGNVSLSIATFICFLTLLRLSITATINPACPFLAHSSGWLSRPLRPYAT